MQAMGAPMNDKRRFKMVRDSIKTHALIGILHNFGVGVLEIGESFDECKVGIILSREGIRTWADFQKAIDDYAQDITGVMDQVSLGTADPGDPGGDPGKRTGGKT